ncbi:MAG: hypothetical protein Q7V00_07920 [Sulfurimicrobium sp.]|nr:hypothetical protein [Sulfurimicrobium sp.]MDP1703677.1 hypothetical protein [Sulfurimicrobium sp.]MDP2197047.1 hypothetical protein [Sulfurimicrobium sp.]MDP3687674.1 hypothetical protein [Sulfurimicrobium sp.]
MRTWFAFATALMLPQFAGATSLDEIFKNIRTCSFNQFYYSPWDANKGHTYFANRKPVEESKNDSYVFKVSDTLFGLPVVEIQVPGTWDFHAVTFDVPLKESQKVLLKKFGSTFPRSKASLAGDRPALEVSTTNPNQSILYCNEKEGGL